MKTKRVVVTKRVVFDIIVGLIVRKIAVAKASWLMLSSMLLFAGLESSLPREFTLPSQTCEVWTTESASQKMLYLVLRNARRPNVTSPDYLPNLLGTLDCDGNADSNSCSWDKLFQVISVEKWLMLVSHFKSWELMVPRSLNVICLTDCFL